MHPIIPVAAIIAFARHHKVSKRRTRYSRKRPRPIRRNGRHRTRNMPDAPADRNCPGDRCSACNAPMGKM